MSPAQRRLALVQIAELLDGLAAGPARATPPRGATGCAAHLCRPSGAPLCVAPAPSAWCHAGTQGAVLSGSGWGEPRGSRCGSRRAACREHLQRARRRPPRPISRRAARCSALGLHPPACLQILRLIYTPLRLCRRLRTENGPAAARSRDHRCGSLPAGQRQRATLPAALACTTAVWAVGPRRSKAMLETTAGLGHRTDHIVEIAVLRLDSQSSFQTRVRLPDGARMSAKAMQITGYTTKTFQDPSLPTFRCAAAS